VHFEGKRCSRDLTALRNRYADTLLVFFDRTAASRAGEFHSRDALCSFMNYGFGSPMTCVDRRQAIFAQSMSAKKLYERATASVADWVTRIMNPVQLQPIAVNIGKSRHRSDGAERSQRRRISLRLHSTRQCRACPAALKHDGGNRVILVGDGSTHPQVRLQNRISQIFSSHDERGSSFLPTYSCKRSKA
jgi:hypothetical protein